MINTLLLILLRQNHPNETSLDMGRYNYYTTYADKHGYFSFSKVRASTYGLQAWSNGGSIGDVSTVLLQNDVTVSKGKVTSLKTLTWKTQGRKQIFQVGELDRKSLGFQYGGAPHQHALVAKCPANINYIIGKSKTSDWCFGQSAIGSWDIEFNIPKLPANSSAVLSVSLAGYSSGVTSAIILNNSTRVGNLTSGSIATDPCLYRSGTTAGEWHYYEFPIANGSLVKGTNTISFNVTRTTLWHGFMWDSVILEYAA
jgi:rhamnogalacturonan endolyase